MVPSGMHSGFAAPHTLAATAAGDQNRGLKVLFPLPPTGREQEGTQCTRTPHVCRHMGEQSHAHINRYMHAQVHVNTYQIRICTQEHRNIHGHTCMHRDIHTRYMCIHWAQHTKTVTCTSTHVRIYSPSCDGRRSKGEGSCAYVLWTPH